MDQPQFQLPPGAVYTARFGSLKPRDCEVCDQKKNLRRCSGCQVVYYCGLDHQTAHRSNHKRACVAIKRAREAFEYESDLARSFPRFFSEANGQGWLGPDMDSPSWRLPLIHPYMKTRYLLVDALLDHFGHNHGHVAAVEMATDHLMDVLRKSRVDHTGVWQHVPADLVRIGRDQDAYDWMKWYATTPMDPNYDPDDWSAPFLNIKNADILEPLPDAWLDPTPRELSHLIAVTLIKARALVGLVGIQNAARGLSGSKLPTEIVDAIRSHIFDNYNVLSSRRDILRNNTEEMSRLIATVMGQLRDLVLTIDQRDPWYWKVFDEDTNAMLVRAAKRPKSPKTGWEAFAMNPVYLASWQESPGAYRTVRNLIMATNVGFYEMDGRAYEPVDPWEEDASAQPWW